MITAHVESFADNLEELQTLLPLHWEELALNKDRVPLDPQYNIYLARENLGELLMVCLREEGRLVGYFIGFVAPGLHYKTCLTLTMDIFYVHPDLRKKHPLAGRMLFRCVEAEARRRGVQRMFVGSKCHQDASRLFEALRYKEVERYYTLWLGD